MSRALQLNQRSPLNRCYMHIHVYFDGRSTPIKCIGAISLISTPPIVYTIIIHYANSCSRFICSSLVKRLINHRILVLLIRPFSSSVVILLSKFHISTYDPVSNFHSSWTLDFHNIRLARFVL